MSCILNVNTQNLVRMSCSYVSKNSDTGISRARQTYAEYRFDEAVMLFSSTWHSRYNAVCNVVGVYEGLRTRVVYPRIKCGEWPEMPKKWGKNGIPPSTKVLKFPNY